ncbi:MAG: zf-HC2 domain-containing protein [Undibacterium sp.]|nr:zf-HC2 domain-containing protein [Undibacterium sp.]
MLFFYSCKQAHQKLSESLDHELGLAERTHLKLHLSVCRSCTNFRGQMQNLRAAMKKLDQDEREK